MKKIYILCFVTQSLTAFGQQLPSAPLIPNNLFLNNPAAAGLNTDDGYHIRLLHRNQWLGVNDAPTTQIIAVDKRSNDEKTGIGITAFNDKTHILSQQGIRFAYAYHFGNPQLVTTPENKPKWEYQFSLGLNGGFINRRVDLSNALLKSPNDPLLMNHSLNHVAFDAGVGGDYTIRLNKNYIDEWHIGLSLNHIAPFSSGESNPIVVETAKHYLTYLTYSHDAINWKVDGMFFCRASHPLSSVQFELATFVHHKKSVFAGVGWKTNSNIQSQYLRYMLGIAGLPKLKNLQVIYGFEHGVPTTKSFIGTSAFSHDIGFSFTL